MEKIKIIKKKDGIKINKNGAAKMLQGEEGPKLK